MLHTISIMRNTLRGKQVVVAWEGKRSVACAASYEAIRFGVPSAMPAVTAERFCPEEISIQPDSARYKAAPSAALEVFHGHADLIEPMSLDEVQFSLNARTTAFSVNTEDVRRRQRIQMLQRTLRILIIAFLVTGTARAAGNPFVGSWRLNSSKSKLTDVMKVQNLSGLSYVFNFGSGAETLNVDGTDQPGNFGSTLSVAIEGPNTWKVVRKKKGKVTLVATWTLSPDASTLTDHFTGFKPDGSTFKVDYVYRRKGPGEGFVGEWVSTSEGSKSPVMLQVESYQGDGLSFFDSSTQMTRAARLDGEDHPNSGPNVIPESTCSLRKLDELTLELTFKVPGRTLYIQQIQLSSDLKTMTMTRRIVGESETNVQVFERD